MASRPDSSAKTAKSADDARRAFEVAIEHHRRGTTDIEDLRFALAQFCAIARREQLPPERLVIAVKAALDGSHVLAVDPPAVRESIKQRLVSLAIRTYYAESAPDGKDRIR